LKNQRFKLAGGEDKGIKNSVRTLKNKKRKVDVMRKEEA